MRPKNGAVLSVATVQTNLFRAPSQSSPTWDRMPDVVKMRVVEALAQVLLCASGAAGDPEEALDD